MDNVLRLMYNTNIPSREVVEDYDRKVNYDQDGNEIITWEKVDNLKFQKSLGKASDWSLQSLLKAGIDPAFPIHTGNNTRLEGLSSVSSFEVEADKILAELNKENKE